MRSPTQSDIDNLAEIRYKIPLPFVNLAHLDAWEAGQGQVAPRYYATPTTHALARACTRAEVKHATFPRSLPHCCNQRQAGFDYFRSMAITGHRPVSVFKRYNPVDETDVKQAMLQWDTYKHQRINRHGCPPCKSSRNLAGPT
jgi:hypothetical protein